MILKNAVMLILMLCVEHVRLTSAASGVDDVCGVDVFEAHHDPLMWTAVLSPNISISPLGVLRRHENVPPDVSTSHMDTFDGVLTSTADAVIVDSPMTRTAVMRAPIVDTLSGPHILCGASSQMF